MANRFAMSALPNGWVRQSLHILVARSDSGRDSGRDFTDWAPPCALFRLWHWNRLCQPYGYPDAHGDLFNVGFWQTQPFAL